MSSTENTTTNTADANTVSEARLAANRANALLSTGPKTEAGKLASSSNALLTGLTSARLFARPGEETQALQSLATRILRDLAPAGPLEEHCADTIVHALWNLRRCTTLEAELQLQADQKGLPDPAFDPELSATLDRIHRYRKMHESSLRKSTQELRRLQTERRFRSETGIQNPIDGGDTPVLADTRAVAASVRAAAESGSSARHSPGSLESDYPGCSQLPYEVRQFLGLTPEFEAMTASATIATLANRRQQQQQQQQQEPAATVEHAPVAA